MNAVVEAGGNNALTREAVLQAADGINCFTADGMMSSTNVGARVPSSCFALLQVQDGDPDAGRFRNRSEAEFAGYRAALDDLHHEETRPLDVGLVLHLHRLLFSFTDGHGGSFKTDDNLVVDRNPDGTTSVRFEPVNAQETPFFIEELVLHRGTRSSSRNSSPAPTTRSTTPSTTPC